MTQRFKPINNMHAPLTRRDFLKLAGTLPLSIAAPRFLEQIYQPDTPQNIIIIVFDAFSACNMSLYGYQRDTTPNINRLAERAVVYHNHYAGGNFTTPGTASLLTGTLPWTHRAFRHGASLEESVLSKNIFNAFSGYHRLAYSHNPWVYQLFLKFEKALDEFYHWKELYLASDSFIPELFRNDEDIATVSWIRAIGRRREEYAYLLYLARIYNYYQQFEEKELESLLPNYPRGLPALSDGNYFLLEDAIDWVAVQLERQTDSLFGYFHFLPPHDPYRTHKEFYGGLKNDGWTAIDKGFSIFSEGTNSTFTKKRTQYDEFVLYVDREFGRLMDLLDASGVLENTWIIFTSDHGEMFERGIDGHNTEVLYEPVIRIPLVIFEPGRNERMDIHVNTSAVDILPTLVHIATQTQVFPSEGVILPPYGPELPTERNVYAVEAKLNEQFGPLDVATIALVKGNYKLQYFSGYDKLAGQELVELYDLERDPEEMTDLSAVKKETAAEMLAELKSKLEEVNEPYETLGV